METLPLTPTAKKLLALAQRYARSQGLGYVSSKEIQHVAHMNPEIQGDQILDEFKPILNSIKGFDSSIAPTGATFSSLAAEYGYFLLDHKNTSIEEFFEWKSGHIKNDRMRASALEKLTEDEKSILGLNQK